MLAISGGSVGFVFTQDASSQHQKLLSKHGYIGDSGFAGRRFAVAFAAGDELAIECKGWLEALQ